jgi:2-polyprenyl-3-methyl-5-hydroxy-6-metoxy-1,4-benzoquinol methylase
MPATAQQLPDVSSPEQKGVNLEVCQCSGCGLVQISNNPVPYYKEVIRASAFSQEMKEFRINQFNEFVQKYFLKNKRVIEIGCGKGEYLSLMQSAGVNASGIEYSQESVDVCLNEGLRVTKSFIENEYVNLKDKDESFDAFFIMNFFEHLPDPNVVLRGIYNNLSEDGIGLIEVPNFDMILEKKLFSEFMTDHLFYFTKETLCSTLERNGFEIIECKEVWYDYIISAVVRKRKKLDISHFYEYQLKIQKEINNYIYSLKGSKVAIWGAGHQALAVISLTNIADKIAYVIDDAPFKQGKKTPATHIPIVSSDKLITEPVKAILVMAASYSDEVAKKIQQKFPTIKVAILRDHGLEIIQ